MYIHEAQVPRTSPITRATSKSGKEEDDIICIYDFTLDSFASDVDLCVRYHKKYNLSCFVTRNLQFTIRVPRFTIRENLTDFRLPRRTTILLIAVALARSARVGRQTSVRTRSITVISRHFATIPAAISARLFRENPFAITILLLTNHIRNGPQNQENIELQTH